MLEALWSIEFISNSSIFGSGVAVLETSRVFGGDAQYFYVGSYSVENHTVNAKIKITHYAGQPFTIFGNAKELNLTLSGPYSISNNTFEISGTVDENPAHKISIKLTRRADLP